jgi:hypothetical protein
MRRDNRMTRCEHCGLGHDRKIPCPPEIWAQEIIRIGGENSNLRAEMLRREGEQDTIDQQQGEEWAEVQETLCATRQQLADVRKRLEEATELLCDAEMVLRKYGDRLIPCVESENGEWMPLTRNGKPVIPVDDCVNAIDAFLAHPAPSPPASGESGQWAAEVARVVEAARNLARVSLDAGIQMYDSPVVRAILECMDALAAYDQAISTPDNGPGGTGEVRNGDR